ncbi:hypothetical protein STFE110948_07115 [Streptobacillus felis]
MKHLNSKLLLRILGILIYVLIHIVFLFIEKKYNISSKYFTLIKHSFLGITIYYFIFYKTKKY